MSLTRRNNPWRAKRRRPSERLWLQRRACANRFSAGTAGATSYPQPVVREILKIYGRLGGRMASLAVGGRHGLQVRPGAGQ
jgi:hypothetical protein